MPAAKPVYGVLASAVAEEERSEEARTTIALFFLVVVLAFATLWLVVLPLFDAPPSRPQACRSTFVLTDSGAIRCVGETTYGASARRPAG